MKKMRGKRLRSWLGRLWIFFVIVPVVAVGGLVIHRWHGIFGSSQGVASMQNGLSEIVSTIPKHVTYEVYGPADTTGMISYADVRTQSQEAQFITLPWTLTLTTTNPSVFANIVAQGDGNELGCRITVNGKLRDQREASGYKASVTCLVKAA